MKDKQDKDLMKSIKGISKALNPNPLHYRTFSEFLAAVKVEAVKHGLPEEEIRRIERGEYNGRFEV